VSTPIASGTAAYAGQSSTTQNGDINTIGSGSNNATTNTQQGMTGSSTAANNGTGTSTNNYLPWQQALGAQAGQQSSDFLTTGQLPGTFGAPPQVTQAFTQAWQNGVEPQLSAQYGQGSPALGASLAHGLEQLDAQVYQNQSGDFANAIGAEGRLALNPVGVTSSTTNNSTATNSQNQNLHSVQNSDWQSLQDQISAMSSTASNSGGSDYTTVTYPPPAGGSTGGPTGGEGLGFSG
jgi:hypothetical protein